MYEKDGANQMGITERKNLKQEGMLLMQVKERREGVLQADRDGKDDSWMERMYIEDGGLAIQ